MKARTARRKKLYRYMIRGAQTRPGDYSERCIERWLNREAARRRARNTLAWKREQAASAKERNEH